MADDDDREGAMSWAFLQVMRNTPNPTYVQVGDLFTPHILSY